MKRQHLFGGMITGAGSAVVAIGLLLASMFADGQAEVAMLLGAVAALAVAMVSLGVMALVRPAQHAVTQLGGPRIHRAA